LIEENEKEVLNMDVKAGYHREIYLSEELEVVPN
jgi:hypothetical protein